MGRRERFSGPRSCQEDSLGKSRDTHSAAILQVTSLSFTENTPGLKRPLGQGAMLGPSLGGGVNSRKF